VPVKEFLADNWTRWEAEKPIFVTKERIAQIPYFFCCRWRSRRAVRQERHRAVSLLLLSSSSSSRMTAAAEQDESI
jgi:hypothetical protein